MTWKKLKSKLKKNIKKKLLKEKKQVQYRMDILAGLEEYEEDLREDIVQNFRNELQVEKDHEEVEEMRRALKMEKSLMKQSRVKVAEMEKEKKIKGEFHSHQGNVNTGSYYFKLEAAKFMSTDQNPISAYSCSLYEHSCCAERVVVSGY